MPAQVLWEPVHTQQQEASHEWNKSTAWLNIPDECGSSSTNPLLKLGKTTAGTRGCHKPGPIGPITQGLAPQADSKGLVSL